MVDELKPCPFCGGSAHVESYVVDAAVWCVDCGARIARNHGRLEDTGYPAAIAAWNKRAPDRSSFDAGWDYHKLLASQTETEADFVDALAKNRSELYASELPSASDLIRVWPALAPLPTPEGREVKWHRWNKVCSTGH